MRARLAQRGQSGVLDPAMQVFHVIGPAYADAFGMLEFEIEKYRCLGRSEIVDWYERYRAGPVSREQLAGRIEAIRASLNAPASNPSARPGIDLSQVAGESASL